MYETIGFAVFGFLAVALCGPVGALAVAAGLAVVALGYRSEKAAE